MSLVTNKKIEPSIELSSLTEEGLKNKFVVCQMSGLYLLNRMNYGKGRFRWSVLTQQFTAGNALNQSHRTALEAVTEFVNEGKKIHIFDNLSDLAEFLKDNS